MNNKVYETEIQLSWWDEYDVKNYIDLCSDGENIELSGAIDASLSLSEFEMLQIGLLLTDFGDICPDYKDEWTSTPNGTGYFWALEDLDEVDRDIMLVFVEVDGSIWYGKVNFPVNHFLRFKKADVPKFSISLKNPLS